MGVIDNITGIKVIKPRHEESVRVRFDVTFTFGAAESLLSRISAEDMKKKILFETSAYFYYTDNNGVETEI